MALTLRLLELARGALGTDRRTLAAAVALPLALGSLTAAEQVARPRPQRRGVSLAETRLILTATGSVLITSFLAFAALGLGYTYLVIDLGSVWHWSEERVIGFLFLFGITNVGGNLMLGRLGDLWGNDRAVRIGQTVQFIALLGAVSAALRQWPWVLVPALVIFSIGRAYIPNLKAMASAVAPELRGRSQSWNNAAMFGGMMAGSWAASYGYQVIGLSGLSTAAAAVVALDWSVAGATGRHKRGRFWRGRRIAERCVSKNLDPYNGAGCDRPNSRRCRLRGNKSGSLRRG